MAIAPLSLAEPVEEHPAIRGTRNLPPSSRPLNLLLEWPERSRPEWAAIAAASIGLHVVLFAVGLQVPRLVGHRTEPERRVIVHHIPLYLPPDVLTQRAPNRQRISKSVDLADLLSSPAQQPRPSAPKPSVRHFEVPKQVLQQRAAKNTPQILPEAPQVAMNQATGPLPPGAPTGLTAGPPPPSPSSGPFQNIGTEAPPNPHPKLAPPKANLQSAINGLSQDANSRRLIITDDTPTQPLPGAPGAIGQAGGQHAAVELQSDPQGADFKPYLTQILAIVRANWRRVIPESVRLGTLRGRTVVEFIISRDGSIPKLVTADSSGSEPLDRAAVAGLSMSNPLPPLPSDYKGMQVRLAFSFAYNMPSQ